MGVGQGSASKSTIVLAANPKGKFWEGTILDTSKPGTCLEIAAATNPAAGRHSFQHVQTGASGAQREVIILIEDDLQGFPVGTAYVAGTRCRAYTPAPGEEVNVLRKDVAGTADDQAIGDLLGIEGTTGKVIANSSFLSVPFRAMEAITDPTADQLTWVEATGH